MISILNIHIILFCFSFLISILYSSSLSFVEGVENSTWELGSDMPVSKTEITGALLDGKIYVIGGADYREDGALNTVEIYDPEDDEWTEGTPLPYDLDHAPSVIYDGKIYVVGGFLQDKITTDKMLVYNPVTDQWTEGTPLPEPRCCHVAEVVYGTIYVISGLDFDHNPVASTFAYNIKNDTWVEKSPMPVQNGPKHHAASAVVDGKIYVIGGRLFGNGVPNEINDALTNLDDNWMYDPQKDDWTLMESMPIRRSGFAAESLNGQIFVFGGQVAEGSLTNVERYDPLTNKWSIEPDMKVDRSGLTAVAYNDKIFVFGGQHKGLQALSANEVLIPNKEE